MGIETMFPGILVISRGFVNLEAPAMHASHPAMGTMLKVNLQSNEREGKQKKDANLFLVSTE